MRCVVVERLDRPRVSRMRVAPQDTVVYEVHVKGLTAHPSSNATFGGTFRSAREKIPYLLDLGVTTVELLPVHYCGEREMPKRKDPLTGKPLVNYWGYQPIGFFAPDAWYAVGDGPGSQITEFREMIDAFHEAGIEVILDVVFNHSAEQGEKEPALSFRGIDNLIYYYVGADGKYRDMTGCGNTLQCSHPVMSDLILDCLRYWVAEFDVDGFRFDLACILNRDRDGLLSADSPLVQRIEEDPLLRNVKIIAEPWDLAGGYQVGGFGRGRWAEWNGRYRDDMRRFWRGDAGAKGDFARRITGSPDLYQHNGRTPQHSINFITAHDGFTLHDLVSYNRKHNEANGENNRDGADENYSWNCGEEGETDDPIIQALRLRLQKSYIATLFCSLGVPMLLSGDEFNRTKLGNNNAYCQDNELSWLDWRLVEKNADLFRFCKETIRFRKANPVFSRTAFFTGQPKKTGQNPDLLWYSAAGKDVDWASGELAIACRIDGSENIGVALYMLFNPTTEPVTFIIPPGEWRIRLNTARTSPYDICGVEQSKRVAGGERVMAGQKAMIVLDSVDAPPTFPLSE